MLTKKGFTLIELLIVMAIMGILSAIGIGNFQTARIKARDVARKSDLQSISKSLEAYVNDHRTYPLSDIDGQIICDSTTQNACAWGEVFSDEKGTIYSAKLPQDSAGFDYYYTSSDGSSYDIYAYLENSNDPAITTFSPTITCGNADCNYKFSSSNKQ